MYSPRLIAIFISVFVLQPSSQACANPLLEYLSEETGVSPAFAEEQVEEVFRAIEKALINGEIVKIPAFGTFYLQKRKPWTVRHPRTGELIKVPARLYPRFRSSKKFKERIRDLDVDKIASSSKLKRIPQNTKAQD